MSDGFQLFFLQLLVQLSIIILAARAGGWLLEKVGQPRVVGEIIAGLVLGPSCLGRLSPAALDWLFPESGSTALHVLSELGLVLLMFVVGLEFDFSHLRRVGKAASGVALAGIALPFLMAAVLATWMHPLVAADVNRAGFVLIVAVALSITAIPILGRIMMDLGIQRSSLGTLTITAAAIDDAVGWILLAASSAIIQGGFAVGVVLQMTLLTLGFVAVCILAVRPLVIMGSESLLRHGKGDLTMTGLSIVLVLVFLSAAVTSAIGVFAIFGPFVLGAVISDRDRFREAVTRKLQPMVFALFIPIFFTYTGLRTNVGLLETSADWLLCLLVLGTATVGKMVGCGVAARLGGLPSRDAVCVAAMMNTRALMGLIAINVGRQLGVIPEKVFSMLVIMAVVTTLLTMPLLRRFLDETHRDANGELAAS